MKYNPKILLLCLCLVIQTGCSNQAVYTSESFASDSPFKVKFDAEVATVCESARRSLLGQGYLIENGNSDGVKARKAYRNRDDQNTFIEMTIVCLPESSGSTLFATGVLSAYALKKSTSSASVGLSALGSISLPIGQSADSLVKVSEETINDRDFYRRFFAAVDNALGESRAGQAAAEPVLTASAPEPVLVETPPAVAPEPVPESATAQETHAIAAAPELALLHDTSLPESSKELTPVTVQKARLLGIVPVTVGKPGADTVQGSPAALPAQEKLLVIDPFR